jgi:hypothetical protein
MLTKRLKLVVRNSNNLQQFLPKNQAYLLALLCKAVPKGEAKVHSKQLGRKYISGLYCFCAGEDSKGSAGTRSGERVARAGLRGRRSDGDE